MVELMVFGMLQLLRFAPKVTGSRVFKDRCESYEEMWNFTFKYNEKVTSRKRR